MEIHAENPFLASPADVVGIGSKDTAKLIISDFDRIAKLSTQGLTVLAHSIDTLNEDKATIKIDTKEFCEKVYAGYDETLRTRVRRGIKNLILNGIIAYSHERDIYWLNMRQICKA